MKKLLAMTIVEFSANIMSMRQNGVDIKEIRKIMAEAEKDSDFSPSAMNMMADIIQKVYSVPIEKDSKSKEKVVKEFARAAAEACMGW